MYIYSVFSWIEFVAIRRSDQINLAATPYYHCMTRCVRSSYLCGVNYEKNKDFSHRKDWIVERIQHLSSVLAIQVCSYAIMSNHYHLVLFVDLDKAKSWQPKDIIERWKQIFPKDAQKFEDLSKHLSQEKIDEKIALWRDRLMDVSWFMRCLNEKIARLSNKEDGCKGRFWEGRFKSQALLDEGALLSAMAYVDLNPIRADQAVAPEYSLHTSVHERIQILSKQLKCNHYTGEFKSQINQTIQPQNLMPFLSEGSKATNVSEVINFSLSDYLELIDQTGRVLRDDKAGKIPDTLIPILQRLNLNHTVWIDMVEGLEHGFTYAVGETTQLIAFQPPHQIRAIKGVSSAKSYYQNVS